MIQFDQNETFDQMIKKIHLIKMIDQMNQHKVAY